MDDRQGAGNIIVTLLSRINHLSPSSLALFKNQPALWCLKYLHGVKDEGGSPAMYRGIAVEAGVDHAAYGRPEAEAEKAALDNYALNTGGEITDEIEKERKNIAPILKVASAAIVAHGIPTARQVKVEARLDGVPIPVIGYVDYIYEDKLIDLKTTLRMPSSPRADHAAQVAFYALATGKRPILLYASPREAKEYAVNSHADALADLTRSARALCHALSSFASILDMSRAYAPDFDSFYWDEKSIAAAKEILR